VITVEFKVRRLSKSYFDVESIIDFKTIEELVEFMKKEGEDIILQEREDGLTVLIHDTHDSR
jgi:hypothetical protein